MNQLDATHAYIDQRHGWRLGRVDFARADQLRRPNQELNIALVILPLTGNLSSGGRPLVSWPGSLPVVVISCLGSEMIDITKQLEGQENIQSYHITTYNLRPLARQAQGRNSNLICGTNIGDRSIYPFPMVWGGLF